MEITSRSAANLERSGKFVRQQRFVRQSYQVLQNVKHEDAPQITGLTNPASWISVSINLNSLDTS